MARIVRGSGYTLAGVKIIFPDIFTDHRGEYINLWSDTLADLLPSGHSWKEDDLSISKRGVIRGFHGDDRTYKLVSCLWGELFVVILNRSTLQWESFTLDSVRRKMLLVPPNHGLAHQVIMSESLFWYKQSELYTGAGNQFTINPLDPKLNIPWPIKESILSERDQNAVCL